MKKSKIFLMFDYFLMLAVLILVAIGIFFIYSAGIDSNGNIKDSVHASQFKKQIIFACIGLAALILITIYDYRRLEPVSLYFYISIVILLVCTLIFGKNINGAKSWIGFNIRGVQFGIQPSEFGKIFYILFLAKFLQSSINMQPFKRFSLATLILLIPMGLILLQPDMGTASVYLPIFLVMCYFAGVPTKYLIYIILFCACTIIFALLPLWNEFILDKPIEFLNFLKDIKLCGLLIAALLVLAAIGIISCVYFRLPKYIKVISFVLLIIATSLFCAFVLRKFLKGYQLTRLISFLKPEIDPDGTGYQLINSRTAIGSGGLLGQGYLKGSMSHGNFLPEASTDFIFAIFSEEMGFLRVGVVFGLYLFILIRILLIIRKCSNKFGIYICSGVFGMFAFHFIENVGMVVGLMPITGIPLLFMSYGGSSLLTALVGIGLVMSVNYRKSNLN